MPAFVQWVFGGDPAFEANWIPVLYLIWITEFDLSPPRSLGSSCRRVGPDSVGAPIPLLTLPEGREAVAAN